MAVPFSFAVGTSRNVEPNAGIFDFVDRDAPWLASRLAAADGTVSLFVDDWLLYGLDQQLWGSLPGTALVVLAHSILVNQLDRRRRATSSEASVSRVCLGGSVGLGGIGGVCLDRREQKF